MTRFGALTSYKIEGVRFSNYLLCRGDRGLISAGIPIRAHIKETYDTEISATTLSSITDKVIPLVKEWQQRPLEELYSIVWLDAMFYKVKEEGRTQTRCVYNILGINKDGRKEILGMYTAQSEGANFWLGVISDMKQRGCYGYTDCLH